MERTHTQSDAPPHLTIVIPAYNEEGRIAESLDVVSRYLAAQAFTYEVLVVDDGSTDATAEICLRFAQEHPWLRVLKHEVNRGKGAAVRTGMLAAVGDYALICDADMATPIEELDGFWPHITSGTDIVIASRPLRSSHLVKHQPIYRELLGRTLNHIVRAIAVRGIHDTQCGFKLFTREAVQQIFPLCVIDRFSFDIEVLFLAERFGYRIVEAPVHWYHRSGSKVRLLRDGFRMLTDLFRIRAVHRKLPNVSHETRRIHQDSRAGE